MRGKNILVVFGIQNVVSLIMGRSSEILFNKLIVNNHKTDWPERRKKKEKKKKSLK